MKRLIKWGLLAVVLVVVGVALVYYFYINSIVKSVVETQGTKQMNLKTELDSARVAIFGGEVGLDDLKIANPQGFSSDSMFKLDKIDVKAPLSQLKGNPKRVTNITLDKPKLLIERANGQFNFKAAIEQMPGKTGPDQPRSPQEPPPAGEEMKLIIDELVIKDAVVVIRPGLDDLLAKVLPKEITLSIPTVTMKNIGNDASAQNGAAMRDVAQQVITVLAAKAADSNGLPPELKGLLTLDLNKVMAELGPRLGAEAQKRIVAALPGALGEELGKIAADPNALMKDPARRWKAHARISSKS
jgi:uncharacterized protein involved in outer membrane biogenesis